MHFITYFKLIFFIDARIKFGADKFIIIPLWMNLVASICYGSYCACMKAFNLQNTKNLKNHKKFKAFN